MSTNFDNLVKIVPVLSETFGGICQYLSYRSRNYNFYPRNLQGYWTEVIFVRNVAGSLPFNILKLEYDITIHFGMPLCQM